ncbi:MAG: PHP domain-containing protein [Candidatus Moranbacteria bacterium]|jgi:putative hydrolase|nr:PHP domain-containing protein [Candidatus Moranbacteria bacterium]
MLKIDLHIHTVASGHAQCTILEYLNQAMKFKMKMIGISDHAPSTDTLTTETYFLTLERIPKKISGIRLLRGVEANIINSEGDLDLTHDTIKRLDYVMAGFHRNKFYKNKGKVLNTNTMINALRQRNFSILTHPFITHLFPIDVKKISEEACRNNVLLEINLHYAKRFLKDKLVMSNLRAMIDVVKKNNKKIILGSDAHNIWELADDSVLKDIKKETGLTDKLIINNFPSEIFKIIKLNC